MPFTEAQKRETRGKAAYCCCICRKVGFVEVHHIEPEAEGGPDTLDNAVPLCAGCHEDYGANPLKRKQIREMRDWWYGQVAGGVGPGSNMAVFEQISTKLEQIEAGQSKLNELKPLLETFISDVIGKMTLQTARSVASDVVNTAVASSVSFGDNVHRNSVCPRCGTSLGLLVGSNVCPNCGAAVRGRGPVALG